MKLSKKKKNIHFWYFSFYQCINITLAFGSVSKTWEDTKNFKTKFLLKKERTGVSESDEEMNEWTELSADASN